MAGWDGRKYFLRKLSIFLFNLYKKKSDLFCLKNKNAYNLTDNIAELFFSFS